MVKETFNAKETFEAGYEMGKKVSEKQYLRRALRKVLE